MKSVVLPVSPDSLLSDTISDEPGVIRAESRSETSRGMTMRPSASAALDGGSASVASTA
jgi:hypothetical protein